MRSASVDLPWSMCAMIAKLRMRSCCIGAQRGSEGSSRRARNSSNASSSRSPSARASADVDEPGGGERRRRARASWREKPVAEHRVERRTRRRTRRPAATAPATAMRHHDPERAPDVLEADAATHHHEQHGGRDDVDGRRRERDAPDAEAIEDGVERGVEGDRAERDRRSAPSSSAPRRSCGSGSASSR